MKIRVTSQFKVEGNGDLESRVEALMAALVDLEKSNSDIRESDVSAVLSDQLVNIAIVITTDSWEESVGGLPSSNRARRRGSKTRSACYRG